MRISGIILNVTTVPQIKHHASYTHCENLQNPVPYDYIYVKTALDLRKLRSMILPVNYPILDSGRTLIP